MKKLFGNISLLMVLLVLCFSAASARSTRPYRPDLQNQEDKTLSPYFMVISDDTTVDAMPLKSNQADVKIAGMVASVNLTQVYKNTGKKTLEAIYVFPASTRAAVHAMRMTIGERVIEAEIMERQKARQTYEDAKKEGKSTSLLEQQRPNVFQMNVANILPGDEIKVELKYMELLEPEENLYEFVLPTVVGPRYSNMKETGAPDTEKWVKNPYLHQGEAPPYKYGLSVELNSGLPISQLASPSHEVEVKYPVSNKAIVKVKDETTAGNKDFVLRYSLAGGKIETGLLLYPGKDENFFLMMMEPPARVAPEAVVPREYIFIVDVSGSIHGYPLDAAKALMKDLFTDLKPQEFINVMLFESNSAVLSESGSLPATEANKEKALNWVKEAPGGGGTEILKAMQRALALPKTPNTSRIVVIVTDGYVHVEPEVFEMIRKNLGEANLFPFGIGTSVNRHLIEGMARCGRGEPFIVLSQAEAKKQAVKFRQYIEKPVLTGIKVKFEGLQTYDVEPVQVPDLFALRPITLLGKYKGDPKGAVVVQGKTAQGPYEKKLEVQAGQASPDNSALRLLWARERIRQLIDLSQVERGDKRAQEVTALGLKYGLMSPYTSFVAVDKIKRADGQLVTVKQPLPLPEGVSDLAVGDRAGGQSKALYSMAPPSSGKMKASRGSSGGLGFNSFTTAMREEGLPVPSPADGNKPGVSERPSQEAESAAKVKISLRKIDIQGKMGEAVIRPSLEALLPVLSGCAQASLSALGKLPIEATLTFTITADGKVTLAAVQQAASLPEALVKCLCDTVTGVTFTNNSGQEAKVLVQLVLDPVK
jgi:Ca-activated chloride channel family protein